MNNNLYACAFASLLATIVWGCPSTPGSHSDAGPMDGGGDGNVAGDTGPACTPTSATDQPDSAGLDANCDGVDGEVADAIFVAKSGADSSAPSAGTSANPVLTVGFATSLAVQRGRHVVLIGEGTYAEAVVLHDGVSLHGGYRPSMNWSRSAAAETTFFSAAPVVSGTGIASATALTRLTIEALDASPGNSSMAIELRTSNGVRLEDIHVLAGDGGAGIDGVQPMQAAAGNPGSTGGNGAALTLAVAESTTWPSPIAAFNPASWVSGAPPRATGGVASCGCGNGGLGGIAYVDYSASAAGQILRGGPGDGGQYANGVTCGTATGGAAHGAPGIGGFIGVDSMAPEDAGSILFTWDPGTGGAGQDGTSGTDATAPSIGAFAMSGFLPSGGSSGGVGTAGSGGGGGGAGYGTATSYMIFSKPKYSWWEMGGGGGGGGAGGCGGAGGSAGGGGGASVGLFLWQSTVSMTRVVVDAGTGGRGGNGSLGGLGGNGGDPGIPGSRGTYGAVGPTDANTPVIVGELDKLATTYANFGRRGVAGAAGGAGGHGGQGGAGSGGAGGPSYGVVLGGGATYVGTLVVNAGSGGNGGSGGSASNGGPSGESLPMFTVP